MLVVDSAAQARVAIPRFRAYRKLVGWLVLHAANVPTVPGVVATEWNSDVEVAVRKFAAQWPSEDLLVRSDGPLETSRSPRGGYVVGLENLADDVRPLLDTGRALFLLEPVSPLDDLYSVNFEPDPGWHNWLLEIVGPGFDASDLKRGDVTPHEQVRLTLDNEHVDVIDRAVASATVQAAGRATRLRKAATLLRCDVSRVAHELRRRGETMLLDETVYREIPDALLSLVVRQAARLRPTLREHALDDRGVTLSMSFVGYGARPVFWDVVWARTKYLGSIEAQRFARS